MTEQASELIDHAEINGGTVLVEYSRTEAALAALREKYSGAQFDLTTTAGDKAARAARLDLKTLRTSLEAKRKELKAPAVEFGRKIDDEAKRITAEIVALEDPIDAQIKADEKRRDDERIERERIIAERAAGFRAKIDAIRACVAKSQGLPSERISNGIAQIEAMSVDAQTWAEFADEAAQAKSMTLAAMLNLRDSAKAREEEAARVEAQRLENERIAAEQRAAAEAIAAQQRALAEQAAALAAQQKAIDDAKAKAERKEREAKEAAALAEQMARLEREREAEEKAQREQAEARAAERASVIEQGRDIVNDIIAAEVLLDAIASTANLIGINDLKPATQEMTHAAPALIVTSDRPIHPAAQSFRNEQPTLKLGEIQSRLKPVSITADGLSILGFDPAGKQGAATLYRESDWSAICQAISAHVMACASEALAA